MKLVGGSLRINRLDVQERMFEARWDLVKRKLKSVFGFFLDALSYGAPPHRRGRLGF